MFKVKGAHLAVQRVGRRLLRRFGLTPARFDLMNALGRKGMKQNILSLRLDVVRSAVCEMVDALEGLGWVKRVRAADSRTWLVMLTRRGRIVFFRAYRRLVKTGDVAVHMDYGLARGHAEVNVLDVRNGFLHVCDAVQDVFRTRRSFRGPDLYVWQPQDYYFMLGEPGDPTYDVPFVS